MAAQWRTFKDTYPTFDSLWHAQQVPGANPIQAPQQISWLTCFYNGMLHPMAPFAVKGILWYQGEGDVGNAAPYADKMVCMITSWRSLWNGPDLPFTLTYLAPYSGIGEKMPALRAAQARVPSMIPNTFMATLIDAGMRETIHPYQNVAGRRRALVARKGIYGEHVAAYGPMFQKVERKGVELVLSFMYSEKGLVAKAVDLDCTLLPAGAIFPR